MFGKWFGKGGKDDDKKSESLGADEIVEKSEIDALPAAIQQQFKNPDTVAVFKTPETRTSRSLGFRFNTPDGIDLPAPGKQILILVPDGNNINLQDVFLGHNKKQQYWGDTSSEWDSNGAYTEVLVFDANTMTWKKWIDPLGHDPVKYAERRKSVEYEKLGNYFGMLGNIKPLAFLLISRGKGDPNNSVVTEHSFELMSYPDMHPGIKTLEHNYSPGNRFVDFNHPGGPHRLPVYGGGKVHHKKGPTNSPGGPAGYPGAIPLRGKVGVEPFAMTENLHTDLEHLDSEGRLWINLPKGAKIKSLEISAGARWWNALPDPKLASKAGRQISAYIVDKNGKKKDHFMRSANVGPQGVLMGGPTDPEYVVEEGDKILIEGENHTSYLMGWRILYEADKTAELVAPVQAASESIKHAIELGAIPHLDLKPTNESPGGTQGAKWYVDKSSGERYLGKNYLHSGEKAKDRCATEFIANRIYSLMGIPAPESYMQDNMVFSKEIKGLQKFPYNFGSPKQSNVAAAKAFYGNSPEIRDGFVIDAWLANWDVFGLEFDNVLKDSQGKMVRVDGGGAMFFRGMGQPKSQFLNEAVSEIDTMRNPQMAREAGYIFNGLVTDDDIKTQVEKLNETMTDDVIKKLVEVSEISNSDQVITTLIKRRNWLVANYSSK